MARPARLRTRHLPGLSLLAFLLLSATALASTGAEFEPVQDTLTRYGITRIPQPEEFPGVPAVAVLSVQEYRQLGLQHQRTNHQIVKILTAAGKKYTTIKVPCYAECRAEGRTIKPDGKILNLPSRDLFRNQKFTGYSAPFSYIQFPLPGVEPGDLVEFRTTIIVPTPLYLADYRFSTSYPVLNAWFILSHPADYSYSFVKRAPGGAEKIQVAKQQTVVSNEPYLQTTFQLRDVPAFIEEPYSADADQYQPGVRLLMDGRSGRRFEVFSDWFNYGKFVSDGARVEAILSRAIGDFVKEAIGTTAEPVEIVRKVYAAADRKIRIREETLTEAGFEFTTPDNVLRNQAAAPHEFALFLAACFRYFRWTSDLVLVNSSEQTETSREHAFPLDLDLVFLNVTTPAGAFLLDCTRNGIPAGALSSTAQNRFALGIPILTSASTQKVSAYITTMPHRSGNTNRLDLDLTPDNDSWNAGFRWLLGGELQSDLLTRFRQSGEAAFLQDVDSLLRMRIHASEIADLNYRWLPIGLELQGRARFPRTPVRQDMEILQNEFWDSGFHLAEYLLEKRTSALALPLIGEITTSVNLQIQPGVTPILPAPLRIEAEPMRYTLSAQKKGTKVEIQEKLEIQDLLIRPSLFPGMERFLDEYHSRHMWTVLLLQGNQPASGGME